MAFSGPVRPARDPRDTYMLYVLPTTGPIVGVAIDMVAVNHAGAMNPRDSIAAEVNEIIRQLAASADLRRVDLHRNRAQLTEMRRFMGRIARASGMVYSAPGVTPDPYAAAEKKIKELEAAHAQQLQREREQADRARQTAVDYQRKQDAVEREGLRRQYVDLFTQVSFQRDDAFRNLEDANRALAEAQLRAQAALAAAPSAASISEETRKAYEVITQLEEDNRRQATDLERLKTERVRQDKYIDELAANNADYVALQAQERERKRQEAQQAKAAVSEFPDLENPPSGEKRGTL